MPGAPPEGRGALECAPPPGVTTSLPSFQVLAAQGVSRQVVVLAFSRGLRSRADAESIHVGVWAGVVWFVAWIDRLSQTCHL